MVETPTPISWGDEVRPDSVWSWQHLGYTPITSYAVIVLVVLSRDGSRRIVRSPQAGVVNPDLNPHSIQDSSQPALAWQGWTGIKLHAEWIKGDPGQTVILLQLPKGEGAIRPQKMTGQFLPNGVIGAQTRTVSDPVNPIPDTNAVREAISVIAAGWDGAWHSRYVFGDHLRQQVTGRLVDGLLADIERNIQTLLTDARPLENRYWEAKLLPIETAAEAVCGMCAGDPYVWARVLARNIDLDAFRLRLDKGQIPALDLTTKPWQPGTTVTSATFPPGTDVNRKKELVARWHDTNRAVVENDLLKWYDEIVRSPEPSHEPVEDHFHRP